ncbi:hypothetical protein V3H18_14325 [Methylocystis sp. 9N]|uniref:Type II toxin-antitoxin system ParD family antitoxin n=1 Tax=Methylocystis borbori TaxID=3118750 RepID=A0ABU7XK13_9HYPH
MAMKDTLDFAFSKASALPEPAREKIARELLDRIEVLSRLRAAIDLGLSELDAGLGRPLDIETLIEKARAEHAKG